MAQVPSLQLVAAVQPLQDGFEGNQLCPALPCPAAVPCRLLTSAWVVWSCPLFEFEFGFAVPQFLVPRHSYLLSLLPKALPFVQVRAQGPGAQPVQ